MFFWDNSGHFLFCQEKSVAGAEEKELRIDEDVAENVHSPHLPLAGDFDVAEREGKEFVERAFKDFDARVGSRADCVTEEAVEEEERAL